MKKEDEFSEKKKEASANDKNIVARNSIRSDRVKKEKTYAFVKNLGLNK